MRENVKSEKLNFFEVEKSMSLREGTKINKTQRQEMKYFSLKSQD